ncbi:MAG: InlB B-repeat-containing protein [Oscillospiraceae bacterium]|nr:InlB B-repeat-containing protein [Oscillospiraceae bacterium]
MKNAKKFTMRTIAATLATLSMMSTISLAASAIEMNDTAAMSEPTVMSELVTAVPPSTEDTETVPVDETSDPTSEESTETVPVDETSDSTSEESTETVPVDETSDPTSAEDTETVPVDETSDPTSAEDTETTPAEEISDPTSAEDTETTPAEETAEPIPAESTETAPVENAASGLPSDSTAATYTITFETDGGTVIDPITAEAGTAITAPEAPTKDGFYFADWSEPIPETMPEQDLIITAIWSDTPVEEATADSTALTYTITFDTDGGTVIDPITAEAGTAITAPEAPTKDGFYFKSWSLPVPRFMPEKNTTIKAEWSETPVYDSIEEAFADTAHIKFVDDEGNEINSSSAGLPSGTDTLYGPYTMEETGESSMCLYSAGDVINDIGDAFKELDLSKDQEAMLKSIGTKMVDESFATIAKLYPGSGILLAPFQVLFHKGVDNDPMGKMNEKLDQMDSKLDKLSTKLDGIAKNIEHSTEWIGRHIENVEDMSTIKKSFISLAPSAHELCKDIKGVELNPNYVNNYEKTFMIAQLGTKQNYKDVAKNVYILQNHMYGGSTAFPNMYDAAYNLCADQRMISMEAYEDAKTMVDDLTMSYVSAVALMQEIETAQRAVERFGEKEIAQLSPDIRAFYEFYKKHDMTRMEQNYGEVAAALLACAYGSHKFDQAYNNSDFINKGAVRKPLVVEYKTLYLSINDRHAEKVACSPYESNDAKFSRSLTNKQSSLTETERKDLIDYIRTKRPGMSIDEYLRRYGVKINDYRESDKTSRNIYLVTDDSVIEGIKLIGREDPTWISRIEFRSHKYNLKSTINALDNTLTENSLYFAEAKQEKKFCFGEEYSWSFYECYTTYMNFLFIY